MSTIPTPLETNLSGLPINDLIVTISHMADKAETHIAFQGNLPEYVSQAPRLRQIASELGQARDAAYGGDQDRTAEKKSQIASALLAVSMNGQHIMMFSLHRNDPSALLNAGYEFKQKSHGKVTSLSLLDLVPEVFAKHMPNVSGGIILMVKRARQNASIELQVTDQDPNLEASWDGQKIYIRSRIELKGLEPAKKIYIRARYHEDGGTGRWSSVVCIIVL
jgi:hypothetical protein